MVVVNSIQTSEFAKSFGQIEKTDTLDADVLALFGERVRPKLRSLPSEAQKELEALVKRRRQLVEMRELNRRFENGGQWTCSGAENLLQWHQIYRRAPERWAEWFPDSTSI